MNRFRAALAGLLLWPLLQCSALAQTAPNWTYGYVPTTAQWNAVFAAKQDYLGAPPLLRTGGTMTGPLITSASALSLAGFNLPPGVAPTSPNNGDVWTTSSGMYVRINGVTIGPLSGATASSFAATSPITLSFPAGVVTYGLNLSIANTWLAQQTNQGASGTSPGWYAQITGDTFARVRVGLNASDVSSIAFGPGNLARDAFIERVGAGSLRFGTSDVASPVAQTFGVQNVLAGTSNTAGAPFTHAGSRGTGTGVGGSLIFQTAPAGGSGSAQNALATALTIFGTGGLSTGAAVDQGAGTLNLVGSLYNNGTIPTGTGGYVRATSPTIASPTFSGSFAGTYTIAGTPTLSGTFAGTPTFSGANFVTLANIAQNATAWSLLGNPTAGTANNAAFTITSLTSQPSPAGGDLILIQEAAGGAFKKTTVSAIAAGATVASIAGNTGAFTLSGLLTNSVNDLRVTAASKAQQETGTDTTTVVTPANFKNSDGSAKAWCTFDGAPAGANACTAAYNITSINRTGTGLYTATFTTAFATVNYVCTFQSNAAGFQIYGNSAQATGTYGFRSQVASVDTNLGQAFMVCYGRQP